MTIRTARARTLLFASALVAVAVLSSPVPAAAGNYDPAPPPPPPAGETDDGYETWARVTFSGPGAPVGTKVHRVRLPATCWWGPAPGAYTDPTAMLAMFDSGALRDQGWARLAGKAWAPQRNHVQVRQLTPDRPAFVKAVSDTTAGRKPAWYQALCRDSATIFDYASFAGSPGGSFVPYGPVFRAFPVGAPDDPRVDPAALARLAYQYLNLPVPVVDRNPKVTSAQGATLVGMATWFWVTNPEAVGAPTGRRWIRAQAGPVWAQVEATATGLAITSPAGGDTCTPGRAATAYRPGRSEASACTVVFTKASVGHPGGYPVQVSTTWTATWTASDNTTGVLPPARRSQTVPVPVAEVQTIVTNPG